MAEGALIGIAKSVLKQLGSPAMDELKLLWNHKTQLEYLRNTITTISMVLQDAERQKSSNKAVEVWLEQLKAALYDADDFFDTISVKAVHYKAKYGSRMYHFVFMVKSAHKVKGIRERIDAIAKDIRDFNFLTNVMEQDRPRRESTHSYVRSNEVVGREKEKEDIVKMLLAPCVEKDDVPVIAVVGIGGVGKTTVGQLVYGDKDVEKGFDLRVWACINDFSCLDQVLLTLLESINKHKPETLAIENLQLMLREQIEGKKFLLVLDDVWDENKQNWRKLKNLLDSGMQGSVVLATTRSNKVAQSMLAVEPYYHLQGISDESAWILFKKIAFQRKHRHNNSRLEGLGQQIVKKCANVPLIIVVIASFLRDQEERKWASLVDGEFPTVVPGEYTQVIQALKISYREFPYPVKRCFAFCSLFPKDYTFDKDKLICLWIAEGFVEGDDEDQCLEDRAQEYFFYLVDMCFFQRSKPHCLVDMYFFKMHDLVHDLAKEVAGSESLSIDDTIAKNPSEIWVHSLRHVSLLGHDWPSFPHSKCKVRTFLVLEGSYKTPILLNKVMLNFKALRVLDLSRLGMEEVPDSIGKLTHLRFLDLSRNCMQMLPKSICNLHQLQYLILKGCHKLKELPEEIGGLISMRRLQFVCFELMRYRFFMSSLLAVNHKHGGELRYLERLNKLSGKMRILILETGWEDVIIDAQRASLSKKRMLEEITFEFEKVQRGEQVDALMDALEPHPNLEHLEIKRYGGSKLAWIRSLDRLVYIKLENCGRVELLPLSCIQSLKKLSLCKMSSLLSIEGNISYDPHLPFFPSLETIDLYDLPNLRSWWVQEPTVLPKFPNVINLSIRMCGKLEIGCMPLFESSVEDLKLSGVKEEVMWGIVNQCSSALESLYISHVAEESWGHLLGLKELDIGSVTRSGFESLKSLTSLETLVIKNFVDDGVEEGGGIPWEFLQRLHTVELRFGGSCRSTKGVLDGVEHLANSLKSLELSYCSDLHMPWTSLHSLRLLEMLEIRHVERVIHVGPTRDISSTLRRLTIYGGSAEEWIPDMPWMSFPSLTYLELYEIINLEDLPQGIQHLSSLQELKLSNLPRVTSLPCWISSLPSLSTLTSSYSSEELKKRCENPTGEDWPLIQHIDSVLIYT